MGTKTSIEASCPDCRGPLSVIRTDSLVEFRCLVGHAYSTRGLLAAHAEAEERALWGAIVCLRETANIVDAVADQLPSEVLGRLRLQAEKKRTEAAALEQVLRNLETLDV